MSGQGRCLSVTARAPGACVGRTESGMEILLLRIPEVADRLALSRAKVYELIASGQLRTVQIDGCRRVRTDDLVEYVAGLGPVR